MTLLKSIISKLLALVVILTVGFILFEYYPYIFAKKVSGELTAVERLMSPQMAVVTADKAIDQQMFSFAIGVKDLATGEIFTSSSVDRQWAAAVKGQCAVVKFFPYPPWKLDKDGTYYNARLEKLYDCVSAAAEAKH